MRGNAWVDREFQQSVAVAGVQGGGVDDDGPAGAVSGAGELMCEREGVLVDRADGGGIGDELADGVDLDDVDVGTARRQNVGLPAPVGPATTTNDRCWKLSADMAR